MVIKHTHGIWRRIPHQVSLLLVRRKLLNLICWFCILIICWKYLSSFIVFWWGKKNLRFLLSCTSCTPMLVTLLSAHLIFSAIVLLWAADSYLRVLNRIHLLVCILFQVFGCLFYFIFLPENVTLFWYSTHLRIFDFWSVKGVILPCLSMFHVAATHEISLHHYLTCP